MASQGIDSVAVSQRVEATGKTWPLRIVLGVLLLSPAVLAVTTFERSYSFGFLRYLSVPFALGEIIIIAAAAFAGFRPVAALRALSTWTKAAAAAFLVCATLSTVRATGSPIVAKLHLILLLLHLTTGLALYDRLRSVWAPHVRAMLQAIGLGIALFASVVFALLFAMRGDANFNWVNVGAGISHVRHLAYFAVIGGGIGVGLVATRRNPSDAAIAFAILTIAITLAAWNGGRGGFVVLVALFPLTLLLPGLSNRLQTSVIMIAAVAIGIALSMTWVPPHPLWGFGGALGKGTSQFDSVASFTTNRTKLWDIAWAGIQQRPWFGWGEGQFRWLPAIKSEGWNHPHNSILQSLFQWGVVGTLAFLAMMRPAATSAWRVVSRGQPSAIPALTALAATIGLSLIDGILFYPYHMGTFAILIAILAGSQSSAQDHRVGA